MFAFFGLFEYFDRGSSVFFSCALNVNVIGLFFIATVFICLGEDSDFNGDLNLWDVAKVTDMFASKSISIVENDLT